MIHVIRCKPPNAYFTFSQLDYPKSYIITKTYTNLCNSLESTLIRAVVCHRTALPAYI